jgi:hypothetical protein
MLILSLPFGTLNSYIPLYYFHTMLFFSFYFSVLM